MPEERFAKSYRKKVLIKIIYIWILLFFLTIGVLFSIFFIKKDIGREREFYQKSIKLVEIVSYANMKVIELTMQLRGFVISGDPILIANYWRTSKQLANVKLIIRYLKELRATPEEMNLVFKAKDIMRKTRYIEIHAIKLLATAYQVDPKLLNSQVRVFVLTNQDKALNPKQQIQSAEKMLFSKNYTQTKLQVVKLLNSFQKSVSARLSFAHNEAMAKTNRLLYILVILLLLQSISIVSIIWLRAVSLSPSLRRSR